MTAAVTRMKAPSADVYTTSTGSATVSLPERLRLDGAQAHLVAAVDALDGWYARQTIEGHSRVGDGHDTIRLIDAATQELYRVRAALIGGIRADVDERAARVDRMIAELRAGRAGDLPGDGAVPRDGCAA